MIYEDDSCFVEAFGDSPMVRVVDFLIENKLFDCTKSDIASGAKISRPTLDKLWPTLVRLEIITETRRIGNGVLYVLNTKNPAVKKLLELDWVLTKMATEKLFKEEGWDLEEAPTKSPTSIKSNQKKTIAASC